MENLSQSSSSGWIPFRIAPAFSERPWGFRDLRPWYDLTAPEGEPIGEAWLTGDDCVAMSGPRKGCKLSALFAEAPEALLGSSARYVSVSAASSVSPLLIKVIFAQEKLSVQVHPDDAMARKYGEPRGKTECWYALEAKPGAQVACGLKPGVTLDEIRAGIAAGTLESSLNAVDVTAGDMIFVDAGTVHAIWPGAILLETQQNCDLTYRMYDYKRGRALHIEESLEATRLTTRAGKVPATKLAGRTILMAGDYFCVERLAITGSRKSESLPGEDEQETGLQYLFAAAGLGRVAGAGFDAVELPKGGIVAVPSASPQFEVEDLGALELIRITPRWPREN
ncbi:MAG: type I phosphomannose isomerase catalytic subunit [Terracidiphilus sp.]|jgi:mannose-6-phosphate isomerase